MSVFLLSFSFFKVECVQGERCVCVGGGGGGGCHCLHCFSESVGEEVLLKFKFCSLFSGRAAQAIVWRPVSWNTGTQVSEGNPYFSGALEVKEEKKIHILKCSLD